MSKDQKEIKTGTLIDGIAASQHLDSSGERIMIEGIDISSLDKDGVFNFEHDSKQASSIVGKIIEAKKILKEGDCENERHKYYWDKIRMPYLYVAGELFDAVGHQAAKDVAAMLMYDKTSKKNKETKNLVNFSIEGQRLDKKGSEITKCIARKVSVTITPCNKVCVAEHMESKDIKNSKTIKKFGQHEQNFSFVQDLMNKNEEHFASCEIVEKALNPGEMGMAANIKGEFKPKREFAPNTAPDKIMAGDRISFKDQPKAKTGAEIYGKPPKEKPKWMKKEKKVSSIEKAEFFSNLRQKIDQFKARKAIDETARKMQSERESRGVAFDPDQTVMADNRKATLPMRPKQRESLFEPVNSNFVLPSQEIKYAKDLPENEIKQRTALIDSALISRQNEAERKQRMNNASIEDNSATEVIKTQNDFFEKIKKALTAGSGMGAPSTKVQGDALQAEEMINKKDKKKKKNKKNETVEIFKNFQKKDQLFDFIIERFPNKTEEELLSIAQVIAYEHIKKKEEALESLVKSKNVREQRAKVFGTKSQPPKSSPMRDKHMNHISNFAERFFGLKLKPSGGKIDEKTGQRRDLDAEVGVDKPDWRSGSLESQWNPEAAVHELAHLILLPEGVGLKDGQKHMDKQYADVQRKYGYMKQKRSQGEVQPMAVEQILRRAMGLPASQVAVPVKQGEPPRVSVEDPSVEIATRVQRGTDKQGSPKMVDLIRQAKNLSPENRERIHKVLTGQLKFHHEHGWMPNESVDAKITAKQPVQKSEERTEEMVVDLKKKKKKSKPFHGYSPKKHSKSGGLSDKAREKINREEGSNLKRPVTGKVKAGSKAAKRRKSFCARMSGVKGPTSKEGKLTPKGAALKRWRC